jgi:hypothetical protein
VFTVSNGVEVFAVSNGVDVFAVSKGVIFYIGLPIRTYYAKNSYQNVILIVLLLISRYLDEII